MAGMRMRSRCRALGIAVVLLVACGERSEAPPPAAAPEANAPSDAASPAAAPAETKPAPNFAYLRAHVGKYPRDIQLFETQPLHARLVSLVGEQYPAMIESFGTQGPLSADGPVIYAIGNKPHGGGDEQAILLIDVDRDLINVKLMNQTELQEYRERSEAVELPTEVQTTIANWEDLANDESE